MKDKLQSPLLEIQQIEIWKITCPSDKWPWYLYKHDNGLWSIRDGFESHYVITQQGNLEYEPGHSHRELDFSEKFRFKSKEEALKVLEAVISNIKVVRHGLEV